MIIVERLDENTEKPKMQVTFDNGDLKAFDGVIDGWHFRDEPSMLRFMVAVMSVTDKHVIYVENKTGKKEAFAPADGLLKQEVTEVTDESTTAEHNTDAK